MIDDEVLFDLLKTLNSLSIPINDPKFARMFLDAQMIALQMELQEAIQKNMIYGDINAEQGIWKGLRDQIEEEAKKKGP